MTAADPAAELADLRTELAEIQAEYRNAYSDAAHKWQMPLGRLSFRLDMNSGRITRLYISFLLVCTAAGGICVFYEPVKELGIALLAGAILAFGSFVTQFWAVAVQHERQVAAASSGDAEVRRIRQLGRRWDRLERQVQRLEDRLSGSS